MKAKSYDVIVVGSGAGALTAALTSAVNGLSVLVLEKGKNWGGTSAKSGGAIWIPNNGMAETVGTSDSEEEAFQYLRTVLPEEEIDSEIIKNYIAFAPQMLQFVKQHTPIDYKPSPGYADYYPSFAGWKNGGRSLAPGIVDGKKLGGMLYSLVDSPPTSKAMGKISMGIVEGVSVLNQEPGWVKTLLTCFWNYYTDFEGRKKGKRDRRLTQGNALVGGLYLGCMQKGVELRLESAVTHLLTENNRVSGVVVQNLGTEQSILAKKGVVLAAGGFEHNQQMREQYLPQPTQAKNSSGVATNTGDLIRAAQEVGAAIGNMKEAWWAPTVMTTTGTSVLFSEKSKPGLILVNNQGKRFMNESITYNSYGDCMYGAQDRGDESFPAYVIFDSTYRKKYIFAGLVQGAFSPDIFNSAFIGKQLSDGKMLVKANTVAELAEKLNIDSNGLQTTMDKMRVFAEKGEDSDFGRGGDDHDRMFGDPDNTPNPCLGDMSKGPYYGAPFLLGDLGTKGGVQINLDGQVLNTEGNPIEGLYAAGNCTASIMGSKYPGAGCTLGPAMTIAFKAARRLSAK